MSLRETTGACWSASKLPRRASANWCCLKPLLQTTGDIREVFSLRTRKSSRLYGAEWEPVPWHWGWNPPWQWDVWICESEGSSCGTPSWAGCIYCFLCIAGTRASLGDKKNPEDPAPVSHILLLGASLAEARSRGDHLHRANKKNKNWNAPETTESAAEPEEQLLQLKRSLRTSWVTADRWWLLRAAALQSISQEISFTQVSSHHNKPETNPFS